MAKITLGCGEASYDSEMRIQCRATGKLCAHQRWCLSQGRAVLNDRAPECTARQRTEGQKKEEKA